MSAGAIRLLSPLSNEVSQWARFLPGVKIGMFEEECSWKLIGVNYQLFQVGGPLPSSLSDNWMMLLSWYILSVYVVET